MKTFVIACGWLMLSACAPLFAQVEQYAIASKPWDEQLGNHRAVLRVTNPSDAAQCIIHWRRRDADLKNKRLILLDEKGRQIRNLQTLVLNREQVSLVFEPQSGAGNYFLYYYPYNGKKFVGWWEGAYLKPEQTADEAWLKKNKTNTSTAVVEKLEARTAFDSFYPMEVCATQEEVTSLQATHPAGMVLFTEDRRFPIRMTTDLPQRWIAKGASSSFNGKAQRNEYYVFQIGVFATGTDISNLQVKSATPGITCFNTEGVDARGNAFTKNLNIKKGHVQALWIGVDIPEKIKEKSKYFTVELTASGLPKQTVRVNLDIDPELLVNRGDDEPWRHSRLRWLNSRLGINDNVVQPYSPLKQKGSTITGKTARLELGKTGLPENIWAGTQLVNSSPLNFEIETEAGIEQLQPNTFSYTKHSPGTISWQASSRNQNLELIVNGSMEFDGTISYRVQVQPKKSINIKDIRLQVPVRRPLARYFMGMGLPGGATPNTYDWKWKGPQDSYWTGDVTGGLHVELQGASYSGPLLNLYKPEPPAAWYNGNLGGFRISQTDNASLTTTYSGARKLAAGDSIRFTFKLLVTPVKALNPKDQFVNRYFHNGNVPAPSLDDLKHGIKITNVHHANPNNPYINYPFIAVDSLKRFIDYWHQQQLKVKIYYTIRELTNQLPELWALRSLGDEIFADGKGGGFPWLQEHLVGNYNVQWFTQINGYEECDASILTSGESRWYNYYIEGLRWLVKNMDIDGLYLDDVSFDRNMLKRMRKVMDEVKPGCLIDLHSNTGFSKGPATQYTEYFPYINKLWFGESFMYDQMPPDNWMVEVSGIPFGLMGDMLHGGGNPWKGPLWGMTVRYPWGTEGVTCDPRDIWKVWDDFGIQDAKMMGYWDAANPVQAQQPNILITTYRRKGKTMLSIGSWSDKDETIHLNIDWKKLGIDAAKAVIRQPDIPVFQPQQAYQLTDGIKVPPGKGLLLIIE